jgi:M6 family metalloprotease-like protein
VHPYFRAALHNFVFASLLCLVLAGNNALALAQSNQQVVTGWVDAGFGDPMPGSGHPAQYHVTLSDGHGNVLAELNMGSQDAQSLLGQQVTVTGLLDGQSNYAGFGIPRLSVRAIQPLNGKEMVNAQALTGSQPWVNVLCKFPDVATEPHQPSEYATLFGSTYPGLDDYFRQISYNNINLAGTTTTSTWYTLSQPLAHYIHNDYPSITELAAECAALADAEVYFPSFVGINFMFNANAGCCAVGGNATLSVDGQTRKYRATWMPPWGQVHGILAHEMGHGFGLPHSTGPADNPPNGMSVYTSYWDVMSINGGVCRVWDTTFNTTFSRCVPQGTIAYHLDLDGWIPAQRRVVVSPGEKATTTLEQLQHPGQNTNALIVRIPISGVSNLFYTVEARTVVLGDENYDQNIPTAAVIIHLVNTARNLQDGQALVVDGDGNGNVNDTGAMWLVGETFVDAARNISIEVLSFTATSFTVRVKNNVLPDAPNAASTLNFSPDGNYVVSWTRISWATGYELQIDTEPNFAAPYYVNNTTLSSNELSFGVSGAPDDVYYWRVRGKQSNGSGAYWSVVQSFEVSRPE